MLSVEDATLDIAVTVNNNKATDQWPTFSKCIMYAEVTIATVSSAAMNPPRTSENYYIRKGGTQRWFPQRHTLRLDKSWRCFKRLTVPYIPTDQHKHTGLFPELENRVFFLWRVGKWRRSGRLGTYECDTEYYEYTILKHFFFFIKDRWIHRWYENGDQLLMLFASDYEHGLKEIGFNWIIFYLHNWNVCQ